jgi:lysyl-tRNA synthetase, class II
MRSTVTAARNTALILTGVIVVTAATAVLYVVRGATATWPGTAIGDALPLDELSGHGSDPLLIFVLVWGLAALLLGILVRRAAFTRGWAALVLLFSVGGWLFLSNVVSLSVVRELPVVEAIRMAQRADAAYLPALLAAAAGAIFGLARERGAAEQWAPVAIGWLVALAGVTNALAALTPPLHHRLAELERFAPDPMPPIARALIVPIGAVLGLTARGLARRKRRAWQIAVGLLALSAALHIARGLEFEAAAGTGLLAILLVAYRREFAARGDPTIHRRLALRVVAFAAAIYGYGALAVLVNREMADQPFTLSFAATETTRALFGLTLRGSAHFVGDFGHWFPVSILLLGTVGMASTVGAWLAPWRYRHVQLPGDRETARRLLHQWGTDTIAPFTLREDKSFFFAPDREAFLAYTVVAGVAIVSGDPVGRAASLPTLVSSFLEFAHARDWRVAILEASERLLGGYHQLGLRAAYHGDEAVIEADRFSLEGRDIRKVRQSVHRARREGFVARVAYGDEVEPELRPTLEGISRLWQRGRQTGFVMEFDSLFGRDEDQTLFVIGLDACGNPAGFLHFAVSSAGSALSLSTMPRRPDTPNGFNEWLICESIGWAREHGFRTISLNFAPFATLLDPDIALSGRRRLQREALLALKSRLDLQLDNLLRFTGQFHPTWQRRYVVFERRADLPRVGLAALSAEGFLPFGERRAA